MCVIVLICHLSRCIILQFTMCTCVSLYGQTLCIFVLCFKLVTTQGIVRKQNTHPLINVYTFLAYLRSRQCNNDKKYGKCGMYQHTASKTSDQFADQIRQKNKICGRQCESYIMKKSYPGITEVASYVTVECAEHHSYSAE